MKAKTPTLLFGIVKSFDKAKGFGSIVPETGGAPLRFESSAVRWQRSDSPRAEMRLTYELGACPAGEPRAVNLQAIARTYI